MSFKIPDYLLTNDREDFKDDPRDVPHYYEQRHENKLNGFIAGLGTGLLNTFTASIVDTATRKSIQILDTIKGEDLISPCLLYTSPSPRDRQKSRMPSSA